MIETIFKRATIGYLLLVIALLRIRRRQLSRHVHELRLRRDCLRSESPNIPIPTIPLQINGKFCGSMLETGPWMLQAGTYSGCTLFVIPHKLANISFKLD